MTDTLHSTGTTEQIDGGRERSWWVLVLTAVLVLAAGVGVGWIARGDSGDGRAVRLVTVAGSELTSEQEQMWGMLEQYVDELRGGDYEAAESWFFNDGGIRVLDGFDVPYGEFETMLAGAPWMIDEILDTAMVSEDHIVFFHRDVNGLLRANDVRFGDFANGEFHIEEHRLTD